MAPATQQSIRTERLLLRPIEPLKDAEAMFDIGQQPETMMWTSSNLLTDVKQAEAFLAKRSGPRPGLYNFAITLADDPSSKYIGAIGSKKLPEIGYVLNSKYAGKGYMTEALKGFLSGVWDCMPSAASGHEGAAMQGYDYLVAHCDVENEASMRILIKCGFVRGKSIDGGNGTFNSPMQGLRDGWSFFLPRPGHEIPIELRSD